MAAWMAFNSYLTHRYSRMDETDRNLVNSFCSDRTARLHHDALWKSDTEYAGHIRRLASARLYNRRGQMLTISTQPKLLEVFNCVYEVRNNLFHGGKVPDNARDQSLSESSRVIVQKHLSLVLPGLT
jgi:hypothetical protein